MLLLPSSSATSHVIRCLRYFDITSRYVAADMMPVSADVSRFRRLATMLMTLLRHRHDVFTVNIILLVTSQLRAIDC